MIRVSILGATGYSGGELLNYLLQQPDIKIQHLTSESSPGKSVSEVHPELRGRTTHRFESLSVSSIKADSDVVFSCYPAGIGIKPDKEFFEAGLKVIDFSGDFRFPTAGLYKKWYGQPHSASYLLKKAVYGCPELFREKIKRASLIANPGCYATASLLSLTPLLRPLIIDPKSIIIDAKSGVSGAGKKVSFTYLFTEVNENLQPYSVARHRHQPEIECVAKSASGVSCLVTFSPHLVPMNRGILSLTYAVLKKSMTTKALHSVFQNYYENEPFIRVLPEGSYPQTKNVAHTNFCDISITSDERTRRVIVMAALDNLVKGAAGQALQNFNLIMGRPETRGLI